MTMRRRSRRQDGMQSSSTPISIVDNNNQIAWLLGFYLQDEWHPTPKLTINFGARWDWMSAFVTAQSVEPAPRQWNTS